MKLLSETDLVVGAGSGGGAICREGRGSRVVGRGCRTPRSTPDPRPSTVFVYGTYVGLNQILAPFPGTIGIVIATGAVVQLGEKSLKSAGLGL